MVFALRGKCGQAAFDGKIVVDMFRLKRWKNYGASAGWCLGQNGLGMIELME